MVVVGARTEDERVVVVVVVGSTSRFTLMQAGKVNMEAQATMVSPIDVSLWVCIYNRYVV